MAARRRGRTKAKGDDFRDGRKRERFRPSSRLAVGPRASVCAHVDHVTRGAVPVAGRRGRRRQSAVGRR